MKPKRIGLALVVLVALIGSQTAVVAAQEGCPLDFDKMRAIDHDMDHDGDGWVCVKETPGETVVVDNRMPQGPILL